MSDICGILSFENQPVNLHKLSKMMAVVNYPTVDGEDLIIDGELGLAYKHQATITDFSKTKLPFVSKNKDLLIVADARIDNRYDLIKKLNLQDIHDAGLPDVELIISAYRKWGASCGAHIIGDYAIVIWDKAQKNLICIRDVFGNRPIFYYRDGKRFIFASQIKQILVYLEVPLKINEIAIAHYLTGRPLGYLIENTFYKNISRIKPAHVLQVDVSGQIHTKKYWDIDRNKTIKLTDDNEYSEAFFSLLSTSVNTQSRSENPIAIMVSGGMDSTSVAGMMADNGNHNYELFNISYGEGHAADESKYVKELANSLGASLTTIDGSKNLPLSNLIDQANNFDEPLVNWDYANADNCLACIRQAGCRVIMTGYSGDSLFLVQPTVFIDYLKQGRFLHAYKEYKAYITKRSEVSHAQMWRYFVHQLTPEKFKTMVKKNTKKTNQTIHPHLWNQICKDESLGKSFNLSDYGFSTNHQNQRYYYFSEYFVNLIQVIHQLSIRNGLESRDPLGDRRIIEFMLAIPPEQCLNNGITKYILRNLTKGLIPESIRLRQDKTVFDSVLYQGLSQWISNEPSIPGQKWLAVEQEFIVGEIAQKQLQLLKHMHNCSKKPNMGLIQSHMKLQLLEQWLQKTI